MADGTVDDAVPGAPAYRGGISNGMKIVAVNSRRFSVDELTRAIGASTTRPEPMEFILDNGGYFTVNKVDYHGGLQCPHFERIAGIAGVLNVIAQPRLK
jgi:predicted metalloprotease with PDZ domain